MKKSKDNPVPSLDKLKNIIINRLNDYDNLKVSNNQKKEIISNFIVMDIQKLQNGVETDNGQPCIACGTKTTRTKYGSNMYVCIDCSH